MLRKPIEKTMACGTTVRLTPHPAYLAVEIDGRFADSKPIIETADNQYHEYVRFCISNEALPGVLAMIRRAFPSRKRTAK